MKLFVTIFLITACATSTQQVPTPVKFLEQDAKVLRQGASYSTSVIHQNPKHPDQHAESTINVDFNPQKPKQIRLLQNQPNGSYQSYKAQSKRPKAIQAYNYNNLQALQRQPQQYSVEEKIPQANQVHTNIQHPSFISPQSQSFNVGYSVSFTGEQPRKSPRAFSRQKLDNAEIITGSRKDTVQKPTSDFEPNDFVTNALIELKKQKVSGIKPKLNKFSNNKENEAKSFIGNLAPKTQQYLSYLGDAKPIASSNVRFRQQLVGNEAQGSQVVQSSWTNLSPSVEIYHSKELPQNIVFSPKEQREQSKKFDHAGALQKSQGFDYTNALEGQTDKKPNLVQSHQEVSGNIETNHHSLEQPELDQHALTQPETTQQNLFQTFTDLGTSPEANPLVLPFNGNFGSIQAPVVPFDNFQLAQRTEDLQGLGKQFPVFQAQIAEVSPKFPIDVTLARDPILAANGKNLPSDPHTIGVPFDTTTLQAMQQKLLTSSQPIHSFDAGKGQVQLLQGNVGIAGQPFQGQADNLQVQPIQGVKQNVFQGQAFQEFQNQQVQPPQLGQGFQEFQTQQVQPTQQFNVFEPPQHGLFLNKGFENYFDQYYDKMQAQESKRESVTIRYPKISTNNNNNNKIRSTKGIEIFRGLQPPPMQIARHRRMYMG